jgi:hypothetical protein
MEDEVNSLRSFPMMRKAIRIALAPLLLGSASAAYADEQTAPPPPDAQAEPSAQPAPPADVHAAPVAQSGEATLSETNDGKWHFATLGYIFFAGAHGKTTPRTPLSPVDVDLSFGDVLKAFKFAFMGAAELRKDRLVFLGDLMWVHLGESQGLTARDRNFADVKIDSKTTAITALGGYRVVDKGPVIVDLLAGGRLNGNKQAVHYRGTLLDVSASVSKTWIDPIVATRILAPLGGKTSLSLYGDIGGFGIGSDLTWQGIATVNYQINHKMTLGAGWRYFKINYDDSDGFLYNVAQSGPIISLRSVF